MRYVSSKSQGPSAERIVHSNAVMVIASAEC